MSLQTSSNFTFSVIVGSHTTHSLSLSSTCMVLFFSWHSLVTFTNLQLTGPQSSTSLSYRVSCRISSTFSFTSVFRNST